MRETNYLGRNYLNIIRFNNEEASDETIPEYDEKISMKIKNETIWSPPWFVMYERCSIDVKIGLKRGLTGNKQDVALMGLIHKEENLQLLCLL